MKYDDIKNFNDFQKYISEAFPNININNIELIYHLYDIFKKSKTKRMRSVYDNMSNYMKSLRGGKGSSLVSVDYWKSMGWTDDCDIIQRISIQQRKNSKRCPEYYISRGYSEKESNEKVSEFQKLFTELKYKKYTHEELSKMSAWSIAYWTKLGFNEDEAKQMIKRYNCSCKECYANEDDYYKHIQELSDKKKKIYKDNPDKFWHKRTPYTSKEENAFFDNLSSLMFEVKHLHFGINVQNTELSIKYNKQYIVCDGYIIDDDGIIILEYDGTYWHNSDYDELRDSVIFNLRDDILGIIRINDIFVKNNNIQTIKKEVDYAIKDIKSKKCKRKLLYESK